MSRKRLNTTLTLIEETQDITIKALLSEVAEKYLASILRKPMLVTESEIHAIVQREKLRAVQLYKNRVNCTLLEGKKAIEEYMVQRWGTKDCHEIPD